MREEPSAHGEEVILNLYLACDLLFCMCFSRCIFAQKQTPRWTTLTLAERWRDCHSERSEESAFADQSSRSLAPIGHRNDNPDPVDSNSSVLIAVAKATLFAYCFLLI